MSKNLPTVILIVGTMLTLILTAGAQVVFFGGEELMMLPLQQVAESELPREILLWLDRDKCSEGYSAFFLEGDLYLAARMGECPTGGYIVRLGSPNLEKTEAVIKADFIKPKPWDMVTHVLTYPRTVVRIATAGNCPARATFVGADESTLATVVVERLDRE
jgi:hypothetical protein